MVVAASAGGVCGFVVAGCCVNGVLGSVGFVGVSDATPVRHTPGHIT